MNRVQKRNLSEYRVAMNSLKKHLKNRGITYKQLAKRLSISESGLKKIFSAQDGSFQRMIQICKELELTVEEVLSSTRETMSDVYYNQKQQDFFLENPKAFNLYWALVYERLHLDEAKNTAHITDKESFSILRQLDSLDLIKLLPMEKINLPSVRQIRNIGRGPFIEKIYKEWSQSFIKAVAKPDCESDELFIIRYFRASERTIQDLIKAMRDLEIEFVRRAIQDMRTESTKLSHLRWISAIDTRSFLNSSKIKKKF